MRDVIKGTAGRDVIDGTGAPEEIFGLQRGDTLRGNGGGDVIHGQGGTDDLDGGAGNDALFGGAGADSLGGGLGNDVLYGGAGDDYFGAVHGSDLLNGGAGDDVFVVSVDGGSDELGRVTIADFGGGDILQTLMFKGDRLLDGRELLDTNHDGSVDARDEHAHTSKGGLVIELGGALDSEGSHGTTGTVTLSGLDHLDVGSIG